MNKNKGFTLFEMLVVVSIIGILLGLISTSFSAAQQRARDSRRIQDLNGTQKGLEQYFALCNSYPATLPYNYVSGSVLTGGLACAGVGSTILPVWPTDPGHNLSSPAGATYFYSDRDGFAGTQGPAAYCLCALLEIPGTVGKYSQRDCTTSSGTLSYYCVRSSQ